jgi:tetratricopeptide (TPR) repeat protein
MSHFELGDLVAARVALERGIGFGGVAHRTFEEAPVDTYIMTLTNLALTLACLGYLDQARSRLDEALSEARRLGHGHMLAYMLVHKNYFDWLTRSPPAHLEECLALTTEYPYWLGWALAYRGRSLIELGRAQDSLTPLTQALTELRASGSVVNMPMPLTWLAEAYAALKQPAEAERCLAEAAHLVETNDERVYEAELLHRVPGDLLVATGDQSGVEQHYRQAINIAERQGAKLLQLRASTSLARLWRDQGRCAEARDLLDPIYRWFTEGFDAPDLKDAKSLLAELA